MRKIAFFTTVLVTVTALTAVAGFNFTHGAFRGGYVVPEDPLENTFGLGAEVGLGIPVPHLNFALEANYWTKNYTDEIFTNWEMSISDINIGISAKYEFMVAPTAFYPYLGAGFGAHYFTTEIDAGIISLSDTETKFGAHTFGGFRVPVSPVVDAFVEARYTWVQPDYLGVYGGIGYRFGK